MSGVDFGVYCLWYRVGFFGVRLCFEGVGFRVGVIEVFATLLD